MCLTEKRLGGWPLCFGTAAAAAGYAPSPGRGAVETVPSNSLTDLTPTMARNEGLAYTAPVVIISGALLMLHGFLTPEAVCGTCPAARPPGSGHRVGAAEDCARVRLHDPRHGSRGAGRGTAGGVHRGLAFGRAETGVRAHICGDVRGQTHLRGPAGVAAVIVKGDRGSQPAADSG